MADTADTTNTDMDERECERLSRLHPGWRIRASADGMWKATRLDRTGLTDDELHAGLYMTLIEDGPEPLREALAHQVDLEHSR
jgi:hypothetical protein